MKSPCLACLLAATVLSNSGLFGQSSELATPKLREDVVNQASSLIESQRQSVSLPARIVDPFVGQELIAAEEKTDQVVGPPINVALAESELLARLASQINASGTATLGGQAILLVGQKRLKAGDVVRISFEGKSYELSIMSIAPTSFTVKKGELMYTRPVRLVP